MVWRQAFLAESARNNHQHFVSVFWDLHKCFDLVNHVRLLEAAKKHSYPLAILRMCVALYRAPRRLLVDGIVSRQIMPSRGIMAGVATATTELRLLLLDGVTSHQQNHKIARLNVFVGDITIDAMLASRSEAARCVLAAAEDIAHKLHDDLHLTIAPAKGAVISNDKRLARTVRLSLGKLGGKPLLSVRALGADFSAANPRCAMKTRNKRFIQFNARKPRLRALAKLLRFLSAVFCLVFCTIRRCLVVLVAP